jgi:hypothetical protein
MDRSGNLHHQAANPDDAAKGFDPVKFRNLFGERLHAIEPVVLTMR